jgi:hypothetical protein
MMTKVLTGILSAGLLAAGAGGVAANDNTLFHQRLEPFFWLRLSKLCCQILHQ